ncbi:nucleotidyltransferase domain-containing protein [uncultured Aliivibrio sp.]|uniref:nucleotidyltransferase domain-containing protein n=1 Tax=uncultured Aliivibrio sp. TaxID=873085 RepID=UPI002614A758|nr:nucleotidyltransferase domain-containing protein [uncultured Aliivibrio sp.]
MLCRRYVSEYSIFKGDHVIKFITNFFKTKLSSTESEEIDGRSYGESEVSLQRPLKNDDKESELLFEGLIELLNREDTFKKLYLYGSRAKGTHRHNSDYDFYAVYEDSAAKYLYMEGDNIHAHSDYRVKLKRELKARGIITRFDLMAARETWFDELKIEEDSHAWQCLDYGRKLYDREET